MKSILVLIVLAVVLASTGAASAQSAPKVTRAPEIANSNPPGASMALPPTFKLDGLHMVWQQLNRCSAAALTIDLTYYKAANDYGKTMAFLNPNIQDVSVRLDEMESFVLTLGLRGIARTGGTIDLLRTLVSNGFPVLVENTYFDGDDLNRDWMSHNRVIVGYDADKQVLFSFDSLLGAGDDGSGRAVAYDDFEKRWQPFNHDYFVIYRPEEEPLLRALMGDQWDMTANAEWTLQQAEDELSGPNADSFAEFNKGSALATLGRYQEAADAYDKARKTGLPWRFMWYQYGPLASYYALGRYDDTIQIARGVISETPGVEEMYYYLAFAYLAKGDAMRARANLEAALMRNTNFSAAKDALAALTAGQTPTFVPVM